MNTTRALAEFVADEQSIIAPDILRAKMHVHLVDTISAGIAGASTSVCGTLRSVFLDGQTDHGQCGVWGTTLRTSARSAAFVNGASSHQLEIDDTDGCDHSGAAIVPAVLAIAQRGDNSLTMAELLDAIAVGYEVARRVQYAFGGYAVINSQGWHSTSLCGPFGSAAAAARAAKLTLSETANAIGLVSSTVSGTWSFKSGGGDNKILHTAQAAANGLEAVDFARSGMTGTTDAFEDTWGGLVDMLSASRGDREILSTGFYDTWHAAEASIKPYASCASTHPMVEIALQMVSDGVHIDSIERIEIHVSDLVAQMCGEVDLEKLHTVTARKFSIPYVLSVVISRGALSLQDIIEIPSCQGQIHSLLARCSVITDQNLHGAQGHGSLTIVTRGATRTYHSKELQDPKKRLTTMSHVLEKSYDVLTSTGQQHFHEVMTALALAEESTPVTSLLP